LNARCFLLLAALALSSVVYAQRTEAPAEEDSRPMNRDEQGFGKLNPNAPPELSRFAFLIGKWRCEAKLRRDDGTLENLKGTWEGRYILDGYAIADEYRMTTAASELLVLGENLRAYDAKNKTWNIKWLNALAGTWVDLGTEELGGIKADENAITYLMKEDAGGRSDAAHVFTRATYANISQNHFTWRGERSSDRKTWEEFLVIQCYRDRN
jgi:hypothetical protein